MQEISFAEILDTDQTRIEKAKKIADKIRLAKNYSWVGLYDVKDKEISIIAFAGRSEPVFTSFPKDKGLNGRAVTMKQTIIVNDTNKDEDYLLTFSDTESEIIVPVFAANNGTVKGTIDAESEDSNAFNADDAAFLEACAVAIRSIWNNQQ